VLSDPQKRAIFDKYGEEGLKRGLGKQGPRSDFVNPNDFVDPNDFVNPNDFVDPTDLFRQFFGNSFGRGFGDPFERYSSDPFERSSDPFERMNNHSNSVFNDPFFSNSPFRDPFFSNSSFFSSGPFFSRSNPLESAFNNFNSFGQGVRSQSQTVRIVNGQRTVVTTTIDEHGNKTITTENPDGTVNTSVEQKYLK
jgi:curved DNA-binding protein CbpA